MNGAVFLGAHYTTLVAKLRKNSCNWGKNYGENQQKLRKNSPYCTNRTFRTVRNFFAKTRYHECSDYTKKNSPHCETN